MGERSQELVEMTIADRVWRRIRPAWGGESPSEAWRKANLPDLVHAVSEELREQGWTPPGG